MTNYMKGRGMSMPGLSNMSPKRRRLGTAGGYSELGNLGHDNDFRPHSGINFEDNHSGMDLGDNRPESGVMDKLGDNRPESGVFDKLGDNRPESGIMDNLAEQGRGGDTMIRDIDGNPSHVNAYEAFMIDNYGPDGEEFTKELGSGSINPITGMREYTPKWQKKLKKWNVKHKINWTTPGRWFKQAIWRGLTPAGHTKWFWDNPYEDSENKQDKEEMEKIMSEYGETIKTDYNRAFSPKGTLWQAYNQRNKQIEDQLRDTRSAFQQDKSKIEFTSGMGQTSGTANLGESRRNRTSAYETSKNLSDLNYDMEQINKRKELAARYMNFAADTRSGVTSLQSGGPLGFAQFGSSYDDWTDPNKVEFEELFGLTEDDLV